MMGYEKPEIRSQGNAMIQLQATLLKKFNLYTDFIQLSFRFTNAAYEADE